MSTLQSVGLEADEELEIMEELEITEGLEERRTSATVYSAARQVYDIPEIRSRILSMLKRRDLARFMSVERGCMWDVARILYRSMSYKQMMGCMSRSTPRQEMYFDSVRNLDARAMPIPRSTWTEFGIRFRKEAIGKASSSGGISVFTDGGLNGRSEYDPKTGIYTRKLIDYEPILVDLALQFLLQRFPSLLRVEFGALYPVQEGSNWFVDLNPRRRSFPPNDPAQSTLRPATGHVRLLNKYQCDLRTAPPESIRLPSPPSDCYTLSYEYEICTYKGSLRKAIRTIEWVAALRGDMGSIFTSLSPRLKLEHLHIDLSTLASICERQAPVLSSSTYRELYAPNTLPPNLRDLRTFASTFGASLGKLHLASNSMYIDDHLRISFADIPALTTLIRTHLPHLSSLSIAIRGIGTAEEDCSSWLSSDILNRHGSISALDIFTADYDDDRPLPNVIRWLSPLCSKKSNFKICVGPSLPSTLLYSRRDTQTDYLRFLRSQPRNRRRHLSTVDFTSLDIFDLKGVSKLAFRTDGRPIRQRVTKAKNWQTGARQVSSRVSGSLVPRLLSESEAYAAVIHKSKVVLSTGSSAENLEEAQKWLEAIRKVTSVGLEIENALRANQRVEREIKAYIKTLGGGSEEEEESHDSAENSSDYYSSDYTF